MKGVAAPIEVYELVGAVAIRSRLHSPPRRADSRRSSGRDAEIAELGRALERAGWRRAGRGAGGRARGREVRLYWEFTRSHVAARLARDRVDGAVAYGKRHAVPARRRPDARATSGSESATRHRAIRDEDRRASCSRCGLSPTRRCRRCSPCWACPSTSPPGTRSAPSQRRHRILDAVKRVSLRESERQPVARRVRGPALDRRRDAGAARHAGREPADRARAAAGQLPAGVSARLGGKSYYAQLRIEPLGTTSDRGAARRACSAPEPALEPLKRLLVDRTRAIRSSSRRPCAR